ncbi:glucose/sorbosone family PQQ-dependent dehydrogenase [Deinococcus planocerae]|uniref:glucose/sorbosone family PQQ-dependent dehydrogenase n=1 Tax=Deinococcus planocerae TaxID=1737569 RepID=UPI000C7F6A30|nr:glucose/sorbosone family PQQ-dependent dehydrogenase [Deinococcus planocerae]
MNFRLTPLTLGTLLVSVTLAGCASTLPGVPGNGEAVGEPFTLRVVTTGLEMPWEMTLGPDGQLWVTERLGKRVVRVDPTTGRKQVAVTIPDVLAGGQHQGVLGMALHPDLLKNAGRDWVYVAYTSGTAEAPTKKIVRYTFDRASGQLTAPSLVIDKLPAGNDHNAGRLKIGPDGKLYFTMGDLGHNQFANYCKPITSQVLPTAAEITAGNWVNYTGKTLRLNLDGSIPDDNPSLNGVVSHVFTVGHRNPQGIDFSRQGVLYSSEQGPNTDDEVNVLERAGNYGWPNVVGYQDDQSYVYGNWSAAPNCASLTWAPYTIPDSVPQSRETEFSAPNLKDALITLWTVPNGHDFTDTPIPNTNLYRPNMAPSSIEVYESAGIPGWERSLLVPSLKHGAVYRVPIMPSGLNTRGEAIKTLPTNNRYRDTAVSNDGRTIYVITDSAGQMLGQDNQPVTDLANPGSVLAFTYTGK